ncbi:MAG: hypothetical protein HQ537_00235 [Parcubacteria group bacterium]|nr:hypothetical protein [Parcubacteria group bacterium]
MGSLHQEDDTIGVILELDTCSYDGSSFESSSKSVIESITTNGQNDIESVRFTALKVKDWVVPDEQENLIYSESEIKKEILSTGITSETSSDNIYFLNLPLNIAASDYSTISCYVRDILWKKGLYVEIISNSQQNQKNRKCNHKIIDP